MGDKTWRLSKSGLAKSAVLLTVVALSGCSASSDGEGAVPGENDSAESIEGGPRDLPIIEYMLSEEEYLKLKKGHDYLVRMRMNEKGFDWDPPVRDEGLFQDQMERRYGAATRRELAQEYGYHLPPDANGSVPPPGELAEAAREALTTGAR